MSAARRRSGAPCVAHPQRAAPPEACRVLTTASSPLPEPQTRPPTHVHTPTQDMEAALPKPPTAALEGLSLEETGGAGGADAPKKGQPENTMEGEHHVDVD